MLDVEHLEQIRRDPAIFAHGGTLHLVLEVLAYPADGAVRTGAGHAVVTLHPDGSVSVTDNGRGTDTRVDDRDRTIRKPVMAMKDLRFFDSPGAATLPDGHPRRGMSVVAALSVWLVHTNRRLTGSWTQRYRHGIPTTDLTPVPDDGTTGTTVCFLPDATLLSDLQLAPGELLKLAASLGPPLAVEVVDGRG